MSSSITSKKFSSDANRLTVLMRNFSFNFFTSFFLPLPPTHFIGILSFCHQFPFSLALPTADTSRVGCLRAVTDHFVPPRQLNYYSTWPLSASDRTAPRHSLGAERWSTSDCFSLDLSFIGSTILLLRMAPMGFVMSVPLWICPKCTKILDCFRKTLWSSLRPYLESDWICPSTDWRTFSFPVRKVSPTATPRRFFRRQADLLRFATPFFQAGICWRQTATNCIRPGSRGPRP